MAKTIEIRPLAEGDDRSGSSCGQSNLDLSFEHYADQNQSKLHPATTPHRCCRVPHRRLHRGGVTLGRAGEACRARASVSLSAAGAAFGAPGRRAFGLAASGPTASASVS